MLNHPGNPYALLVDGVVTEVVYMLDRSQTEIEEELGNHVYDEYISWQNAGKEIYVGYVKYDDKYVPVKPFKTWILNKLEFWVPPVPYPEIVPGKFWKWEDETVSWVLCDTCGEDTQQ